MSKLTRAAAHLSRVTLDGHATLAITITCTLGVDTDASRLLEAEWPAAWAAFMATDEDGVATTLRTKAPLVPGIVRVTVWGTDGEEHETWTPVALAGPMLATMGPMVATVEPVGGESRMTLATRIVLADDAPADLAAAVRGTIWLDIEPAEERDDG